MKTPIFSALVLILSLALPLASGGMLAQEPQPPVSYPYFPYFPAPPHPDLIERWREEGALPPFCAAKPISPQSDKIGLGPWEPRYNVRKIQPTGTFKALALLVEFPDQPAQVSANFFDTLIFGTGLGTVRNYWKEVSYQSLDIVTLDLPSATGWAMAPQVYSYYVAGNYGWGEYPHNVQKLVEDVVDLADPVVDFSQYDNDGDGTVDALIIVHTGPGAELSSNPNYIWSHVGGITPRPKDGKYIQTYAMVPEYAFTPGDMTIGVYCHELGHVFGLPDLYGFRDG